MVEREKGFLKEGVEDHLDIINRTSKEKEKNFIIKKNN